MDVVGYSLRSKLEGVMGVVVLCERACFEGGAQGSVEAEVPQRGTGNGNTGKPDIRGA